MSHATQNCKFFAKVMAHRHDGDGRTALVDAAQKGETEPVKHLIAVRVALNVQTKDGLTALCIAAFDGHTAIVAALIAAGGAVDVQTSQ